MKTSSAAPGNEGLLLQLVTVCHEPVVPVQLTTAAAPGALAMTAIAEITANTRGFFSKENCARDFMTFLQMLSNWTH